jgi:hypothetical protein
MTAPDRLQLSDNTWAVCSARGVQVRRVLSPDTEVVICDIPWGTVDALRAKRPASQGLGQ